MVLPALQESLFPGQAEGMKAFYLGGEGEEQKTHNQTKECLNTCEFFFPDLLLLHDTDYVCLNISFSIWHMSFASINFKCMHVAESEWSLPG